MHSPRVEKISRRPGYGFPSRQRLPVLLRKREQGFEREPAGADPPQVSIEQLTLLDFRFTVQSVVASFRNKGLEEIYLTGKTRRIGVEYVGKCVRILQPLRVATQPEEMNVTGYRFHSLQGSPRRWAVRVNGNFRITFAWSGESAQDVDFEDYH